MRPLALVASCVLALASAAAAQGPGGAAERRAVAAAVAVRSYEQNSSRFAPGVVIRTDKTSAIVLTTSGCCGRDTRVEVVFDPGTPAARSVDGRVLVSAKEPDSWATVRVDGLDPLPDPLPFATDTELAAAETVYLLGLDAAPEKDAAPGGFRWRRLAVTRGLQSVRGRVHSYAVTGAFTAADGGCPVTDRSGRILGLLSRTRENDKAATFERAEPLVRWLDGVTSGLGWTILGVTGTKVKVEITLKVASPLGHDPAATFAWIQASRLNGQRPATPGEDGEWSKALAAMRETALDIEGVTGRVTLELTRAPEEVSDELIFQVKFRDPKGRTRWGAFSSVKLAYEAGKSGKDPESRQAWIPEPVGAAPAGVPGAPMDVAGRIVEAGRLARRAALVDVRLSPDGATLYALDLSDCRLLFVDALTMTLKREVDFGRGVAAISFTPDGRSLWVASHVPSLEDGRERRWTGKATRYAWPGLEADPPVALSIAPRQIVAADDGTLFLSGIVGDDYLRVPGLEEPLLPLRARLSCALHPGQGVIYTSATSAVSLRAGAGGSLTRWSRKDAGDGASGETVISPDGRWVVSASGTAASVEGSAARDFLKSVSFEPCDAIAAAAGTSTFFTATRSGAVRQYEFGEFVMRREHQVGSELRSLAFDPVRRRLYAVALGVSDDPNLRHTRARAGDLVAYSLEAK